MSNSSPYLSFHPPVADTCQALNHKTQICPGGGGGGGVVIMMVWRKGEGGRNRLLFIEYLCYATLGNKSSDN
jgi:hypothetical protein